jgi:hypothetical protein
VSPGTPGLNAPPSPPPAPRPSPRWPNQWADDVATGHRTALLAWRRRDVDDLNRLARARYDDLGLLHGEELVAPGGRGYAVGDRVVTLAPNNAAQLVTSQQLTIADVDHDLRSVKALTDDGRRVELTDSTIDGEHLDHAYALTVHRAQGATYDRAHVFADGGGRELDYVAMSRARDRTTLHVIAHDLPQAIEDLQTDWGHETRQRWITDTPTTLDARQGSPAHDSAAHHDRLRQERAELEALAPPDRGQDLFDARYRLRSLETDLRDLPYGAGRWRETEVGEAAHAKLQAARQHRQADEFAHSGGSLRTRHNWRKSARSWAVAEARETQRYDEIATPVREGLEADLRSAELLVAHLEVQVETREQWFERHPELEVRLAAIDRELAPTPTIERRLRALEIEPPGHELGLGR